MQRPASCCQVICCLIRRALALLHMLILRLLTVLHEAYLWKRYYKRLGAARQAVVIDVGTKAFAVCMQGATADLCLDFCGPVSMARSKDAIEICHAFGFTFYVTNVGVHSMSSECFVPAWAAKSVKQDPTLKRSEVTGTMFCRRVRRRLP